MKKEAQATILNLIPNLARPRTNSWKTYSGTQLKKIKHMSEETNKQSQKQSPNANHIDYKDINRLKSNINPHARMYSRKRTGMTAKAQRNFARAIKRARFMSLIPYVSE